MKKCKNCGKEIPECRTFCCRSCSTSWNNKHRERTGWSDEKKEAFAERRKNLAGKQLWEYEKPRYCKHCGKLLESKGERNVCLECRAYEHLGLYKKLGLLEGSLKSRYLQAFEILWKAYFQENLSVWAIFDRYGVCHTTLKRLFNENGIDLRSLSEGLKVGLVEGRVKPAGDPKYKCGWHTSWEGVAGYLRSSYELDYAESLDKKKVPYRVEHLRIPYFNTQKDAVRVAIPDFYLPETNEIVEIKSTWTYDEQEMKDKFKEYRKLGYIPKLILEGIELAL